MYDENKTGVIALDDVTGRPGIFLPKRMNVHKAAGAFCIATLHHVGTIEMSPPPSMTSLVDLGFPTNHNYFPSRQNERSQNCGHLFYLYRRDPHTGVCGEGVGDE